MKQFIKNNLKVVVAVIVSGIVFGGIGVYATSQYLARNISFTPANENFKKENGEVIDNVEDALNELYNINNSNVELIWTNPNTKISFESKTISIDLSKYEYVFVSAYSSIENIGLRNILGDVMYTLCVVKDEFPSDISKSHGYCHIGQEYGRAITASKNGVFFSSGIRHNIEWNDNYGIPYMIYGVKKLNLT